ncbi:hypothetical protein I5E68_07995 [Novosphingobium sp. YJ-S2-02]|uniref:Outer membrane protein beta-barrel domain-containing protein n=1 Tax=Novosphingobium aureum TaxID=2792964 RepID=A0A931HBG5_9SPHN|nr:hypothetical protein [Novosphingobium aureum]MBH0112891.1 hypothetical protein [Novosphingobium aureum]
MRRVLGSLLLLTGIGLGAPPVRADESYIEPIGGLNWNREESAVVTGIAVGHDFDIDEAHFWGIEVTAEKELEEDRRVAWGVGGRFGRTMLSGGKLFVGGAWQTKECADCGHAVALTAGWEQEIAEEIYAKVEFKHLLVEDERDKDGLVFGIGFMF